MPRRSTVKDGAPVTFVYYKLILRITLATYNLSRKAVANFSSMCEGEGWLEAGSQSARGAPVGYTDRRRRRRKKDEETSWEGSERGGKGTGVEDRKEGNEETVGAAGSLYPGQAAGWRDARSNPG